MKFTRKEVPLSHVDVKPQPPAVEDPVEDDAPPSTVAELFLSSVLTLAVEDNKHKAEKMIEDFPYSFSSEKERDAALALLDMLSGRLNSASSVLVYSIKDRVQKYGR